MTLPFVFVADISSHDRPQAKTIGEHGRDVRLGRPPGERVFVRRSEDDLSAL
jgi:hypothetical protein